MSFCNPLQCEFVETGWKILYRPKVKDQFGHEEEWPMGAQGLEVCKHCGLLRVNPEVVKHFYGDR